MIDAFQREFMFISLVTTKDGRFINIVAFSPALYTKMKTNLCIAPVVDTTYY